MTDKLKLDVNNFSRVKRDMEKIENILQQINKYEEYKKTLDEIAIKALENEDAVVKMHLNVSITTKEEIVEDAPDTPKQILDRIKSADNADSFMKAIGDIEKVLEGKNKVKQKGFSLKTDITDLDNLSFLGILEGMQLVLNKRILVLKKSINYKNLK
mgnify:CR=1 FL=1|tara:strand:+ start:3455 stop:3925 length:471 start_codon:yes stop_codon:yes gene_type:complete